MDIDIEMEMVMRTNPLFGSCQQVFHIQSRTDNEPRAPYKADRGVE